MLNGVKPQPMAKGTLDQRPLAHLLIYARERHLEGTMELGQNGSGAEIVFVNGLIAKVRTPVNGAADPPQVPSSVRSLFALPAHTPFAYFDKFDALPNTTPTRIDPLSFVWHPVRDALPSKQVDAIVDRTATTPLLVPASADTNVFGFDTEESRVVARMRDRATLLADLEKISPRAKRIVYVLLVTKRVEAGAPRPQLDSLSDHVRSTSPPPVSVRTSTPPAVHASSALPHTATPPRISIVPGDTVPQSVGESARKRIRDRAASVDKEDYFSLLGVPRDATTDAVRAAFFTLAKQWHPDRLPAVLADVKEACARVFSHMNEAYQTLVDPQKREQYVAHLAAGGAGKRTDEQETIVKVVEAAQLFQKAEILFKRGDAVGAEALVRRAHDLDPKQAEYLALLTWIEATRPGSTSESQTLHHIDTLTQAISRNENCERAYFYRAMLYKRINNLNAAMRDFRTVIEQNPRNVDAQRELRLFNMRGGKTQTQPGKDPPQRRHDSQAGRDSHERSTGGGGLFGGFFNKKK